MDKVANEGGSPHPFFTHHFVGGNAYVTGLIGKDVDQTGNVAPYPELSAFSFSSADEKSLYSRGFWIHTDRKGAYSQQARLAWDRLRHVLSMDVHGPATAPANTTVPLSISIANTGSGHDFPTGFPEGRTAWLALHAYDLATGKELQIQDNVWNRTSLGVGNLTTEEMVDPNFPNCNWKIPAGSADPYSMQFKAVASLGDGCPTLDLPYATPLNLVTNKSGLPIDKDGRVIDRNNSTALPQFKDNDGNGDLFDDSFLRDTRFKPRGRPEYEKKIDRYSVIIPQGTQGPVGVTAAVYYQSIEAVVALQARGGATDVGAIVSDAASRLDAGRRGAIVYIGDGNPTVGELSVPELMCGPINVNSSASVHDGSPMTHGRFMICCRHVLTSTDRAIGSADALCGTSPAATRRPAVASCHLCRKNIDLLLPPLEQCKNRCHVRTVQARRWRHTSTG